MHGGEGCVSYLDYGVELYGDVTFYAVAPVRRGGSCWELTGFWEPKDAVSCPFCHLSCLP